MVIVVIDAQNKWIEAKVVKSATSEVTMEVLRTIVSIHGIPQTLVSDNGSVFTSQEFATFMSQNGIAHIRSAPYHPATNGLTERAVQVIKRGLCKMGEGTLKCATSPFSLSYHSSFNNRYHTRRTPYGSPASNTVGSASA